TERRAGGFQYQQLDPGAAGLLAHPLGAIITRVPRMPPTIFLLGAALLLAQEKPAAHFHHIHLNSTDPASAIQFYTSRLDCEAKTFGETEQAVRTQKSWLLFHKTASAPPAEI